MLLACVHRPFMPQPVQPALRFAQDFARKTIYKFLTQDEICAGSYRSLDRKKQGVLERKVLFTDYD